MNDYKEKFEKMKIAGKLAAKTLDMLTDEIKIGDTLRPYITEVFLNLYVLR